MESWDVMFTKTRVTAWVAVAVLGVAFGATPVFAAGGPPNPPPPPKSGPGSVPIGPSSLKPPAPGPNLNGPPAPPPQVLPNPPAGPFRLEAFRASNTSRMNYLTLSVTVEQTQPDGSDFAEEGPSATSETHALPHTIYVDLANANGQTLGPLPASIDVSSEGAAITYPKASLGTGNPIISATANYTLEVPGTMTAGTYTIELYTSNLAGNPMTFRVGPYDDGSWFDDVVGGVTTITPQLFINPCV